MNERPDILGKALLDHQMGIKTGELIIYGEDLEDEIMDIAYYFRSYKEMPEYEQIALDLCEGSVLDVGAGAGSHALYLQDKGLDVTAIDISEGAVEVMKARALKNPLHINVQELVNEKYDSILLLMNGIGISGKLQSLPDFLSHLKNLLLPGGRIILDSTDLRYLFLEEDGSFWIDLNAAYYGEVKYKYSYDNMEGDWFSWLFIDEDNLKEIAESIGLRMDVVFRNEDYHYLAIIQSASSD